MSGRLTNAGLNKLLTTGLTQAGFPYVIFGTGTQAFSAGLTGVAAELLRKASTLTMAEMMGALRAYLTNSEGNATLSEIGLSTSSAAGTLLGYDALEVAHVKDSSVPFTTNWVQSLQNRKKVGFFTAYGLKAIAAGGATAVTLPYFGVGAGAVTFHEWMTDPGAELARVAVDSVAISGADVVITATFPAGTGTGTWGSARIWDAAANGNLLAYVKYATPYVKAAGTARKAKISFTLANQA